MSETSNVNLTMKYFRDDKGNEFNLQLVETINGDRIFHLLKILDSPGTYLRLEEIPYSEVKNGK